MPTIPPKIGSKVSVREYSWSAFPERAWGSEFNAPDKGIYEFSNARKFDSTDLLTTGIYGVPGNALLVLDGQPYPDMRDGLIVQQAQPDGSAYGGFGSFEELNPDTRT